MWTTFAQACRASLPFFIDNLVPLANFVGLMLVIYILQIRAVHFTRIERELDELKKKNDQP